MISFTVHSKVKRFIRAKCKTKTLITRAFLEALDVEIKRIVTVSTEQISGDQALQLTVGTPKKKVADVLICYLRIKDRIKNTNPDVTITKKFLASVNAYAAAIILASLSNVKGAYLEQLVAGDAVVKSANQKQDISSTVDNIPSPVDSTFQTKKEKDSFVNEVMSPRKNISIKYSVNVQGVTLTCERHFFTAKTTKRMNQIIEAHACHALKLLGVYDPIIIKFLKAE